ncbi:MAG: isoprenylcysteine carboxylmethyltransferase family protein [Sphingomonadaceae bacterium]|nr:isoprenylcysteine carboxylmethyltransferase family protein [Sphingomonadaceae bacterium]
MTETGEGDAAGVRVFPPGVPLLTIVAGAALDRFAPVGPEWGVPTALRIAIGIALLVAAIGLLGFWAVRTMRRTGQSENPYKPTTEIVDGGPFGFTRNPMYLQMVLGCIAIAIILASWWILLLTPLCWAALHFLVILPEETYLERKFGAEYHAYKQKVRRWI